jgi:hypothetical protein
MSKNIDELPQVVDLGHKMGIDHLIAKNVGLVLKELDEEQRIFSCNNGNIPKKIIKSIDKAKNKAKRYNLKLTVSPLSLRTRPVCIALPVNSIYFTWKGKVSACDSLAHLDVPRIFCGKKEDSKPLRFFGDIRKEDLIDIWEKEQYRNFRDIFNRRLEIYNSFSYKFMKPFMSITSGNEEDYAHVLPQAPKECQKCHYLYGIF